MSTQSLSPNNDKKNGTGGADSINGLAGNDTITGLAGNDTLLGGVGNDYLDGGTGNDTLSGDVGNDTVLGGAGNDALDGGADNDTLDGGAGSDTLNGGTGADSLFGGDGNDMYFVDNTGDRVIELAKSTSGKDTVKSSISYTLPVNVENLELTGLANLNGTGNTAANKITGNDGDNLLNGGDGFDTLIGGGGDDTLIGGTGVDQLIGGDGSDTYQISSTEDKIVETAKDGDEDVVESSVNYVLGDNLEVLTLTGTGNINGSGNDLNNAIEGNESDNTINGVSGDDTLTGNGGDDTLEGGAGDDEIDGGEGDDTVIYQGNRDDYKVFLDTDSQTWVVQDINDTDGDGVDEGTDRLTNIETLLFADTPYIPGQPRLSVADISLTEGNTASQTARFILNLSEPATRPITVNYTTVDNTALANSDYIAKTGSVTFTPGESQQTIPISILGDTLLEANETFLLQLTDVTGADLERTQATATLLNDDLPSIAISGTRINEGNSGSMQTLLTVTLSAAATAPVSVQYNTADGTANADKDYTQTSGTLNFVPGETSKTIALTTLGDTLIEGDETFRVQLANPRGATLTTNAASALVTVVDDDVLSLTLSSDKTSLKAGDTANLRMIFSDIPKNFTASDISLTGGNLSGFQADVSGKIYTALFTPNSAIDNFQASLTVAAGSYTDSQGKPGPASNSLSLTGDTLAPSLSISSDKTSLKANETATVTFSFSEMPTGFDVSDISVNGGSIELLNGTGLTRTALFIPTANTSNLNASISVNANSYTDTAGNNGLASNSLNLTGDTQTPSLSISSDKTSLKANETATVTFSFSEIPMGFDASDISVSGGSISALSGTGLTRTALFIPTANTSNLNASISVIPNSYTDTAGNTGIVINNLNLTGDTQAPSLSISSDKTSLKANETAIVTFSFSEMPMGFDVSDISVSGGSISALNGTGLTRTAIFTPTANTNNLNASISVNANSYTDTAGNNGLASNGLNLTGDTQTPSLSISSDKTSLKANETATLTFSFSEMPMGFDASDIMVNGGTLGVLNGNGQTRTALFTPTANTNNLSASISVNANSYTDAVGNNGQASNSLNLTGDTQAPSLSISSDKTSLKANETATVTFSFSEIPTGFDVSDISVSGGSISALSGTGLTRTALFIPTANTSNLNASISVNANTYTDAAGNNGLASNGLNLTGDTLAPSLSISSDKTSLREGGTATLSFTFSEIPTGFTASSIVLSGGTLGTLTADASGLVYTASYTPPVNSNQPVSISVKAGSYTDAAGNSGAAGAFSQTLDTTYPQISMTGSSVNEGNTATGTYATATLTLSKAYNLPVSVNYATQDGTATAGTDYTAASDTLTFNPGETIKTIQVGVAGDFQIEPNETFKLGLSNPVNATLATNSATLTIQNDDQVPFVTITSDKPSLLEGETAILNFTFNTPPVGFGGSSLSISGGTLGPLTVDATGLVYTATYNPATTNAKQIASIRVKAGSYTNADGLVGGAGVLNLEVDTLYPNLSFTNTSTAVTEGNGATSAATLTVSLSKSYKMPVTVNYATQDGTAKAGTDYTTASGILTFNPGETSKTITVAVTGDTVYEDNETFSVVLSNVSNAILGSTTSTVTIKNDELYRVGEPVIYLGADYGKLIAPVPVDGNHVYYFWDRSGNGTAGSEDAMSHEGLNTLFNQDSNGVNTDGGSSNIYRYVSLNGVKLALPTLGDGSTMITSDTYRNATPVAGFADNPTYEDYLAIWDANNGTPSGWVSETYWSATPATNGHATIGLSNDRVFYGNDYERHYAAVEVLPLTQDLVLPIVSLDTIRIAEGDSGSRNATLTVSLSKAWNQPISIDYATQDGTATAGADYIAASDTLVFNPGETSKTITLGVIMEEAAYYKSDESFRVILRDATNAQVSSTDSSGRVTLVNDDVYTSPAGQTVIDLGSNYGKLINPVQVDGGHWFYHWDRSGDGTSANTQGSGYANSTDTVNHDWLDRIFQQDLYGNTEGENGAKVVGLDGDTDNTYRYATLNGIKLALPTVGDGKTIITGLNIPKPTTVGSVPPSNGSIIANPFYSDLLAIWDAYNGPYNEEGARWAGVRYPPPEGWGFYNYHSIYWSATPYSDSHASVDLWDQGVNYTWEGSSDLGSADGVINFYVAVEVL